MLPSNDKVVVFLTEREIHALTLAVRNKPRGSMTLHSVDQKAALKATRDMRKSLDDGEIVSDGEANTLRSIIRKMYRSRGR